MGAALAKIGAAVHRLDGIPVLEITTDDAAPIVDRDNYVNGDLALPFRGVSFPTRIRGRGNSTWTQPQRPYRVRLDAQASLFRFPSDRDWVLLAHAFDPSGVRNVFCHRLARRLNVATGATTWAPRAAPCRLRLNGSDDGLYLLGEHVKFDADRIVGTEASGTTGYGLTGSYSLEIDQRLEENMETGFRSGLNVPIVLDQPDGSTPEHLSYIESWFEEFEDVMFGASWLDPSVGWRAKVDVPSWVAWAMTNEIVANNDAVFFSSVKMTKTADSAAGPGRLHLGPPWDFDLSLDNANAPHDADALWVFADHSPGPTAVWLTRAMEDPVFASAVSDAWAALMASTNGGQALLNEIESFAGRFAGAIRQDRDRWGYPASDASTMVAWLAARIDWLSAQWL